MYMFMFECLCSEKEKLDEADGNHEQGPAGDEYAVVDKSSKRKVAASENQTLYQVYVNVFIEKDVYMYVVLVLK